MSRTKDGRGPKPPPAGRPIGVLTSTGFYEAPSPSLGQLPAKIPGRHRWIVTCAWYLTDNEAADAFKPDEQVHLDHENRLMMMVGCWDCEQPHGDAAARCPAGDEWSRG